MCDEDAYDDIEFDYPNECFGDDEDEGVDFEEEQAAELKGNRL